MRSCVYTAAVCLEELTTARRRHRRQGRREARIRVIQGHRGSRSRELQPILRLPSILRAYQQQMLHSQKLTRTVGLRLVEDVLLTLRSIL